MQTFAVSGVISKDNCKNALWHEMEDFLSKKNSCFFKKTWFDHWRSEFVHCKKQKIFLKNFWNEKKHDFLEDIIFINYRILMRLEKTI